MKIRNFDRVKKLGKKPTSLFRGGVAFLEMHVHLGRVVGELYGDLAPLAVFVRVARAIADHVLRADLAADDCGDLWNLAAIVGSNVASAADAGDLVEPTLAPALFKGLYQEWYVVEQADGIGQDIRLGEHRLHFFQRVTALVVAPVGDDDHSAPLIARRAQL